MVNILVLSKSLEVFTKVACYTDSFDLHAQDKCLTEG